MVRFRLDPTSPTGISAQPQRDYTPYFAGGAGKPSLLDSVNGKHGAVRITAGSNVTVDNSGETIEISATGGGGGTTLPTDAIGWLHDDGAGVLAWSTPAKSDVGLGNVDNTSDATKNSAIATLTNKTLTTPVVGAGSNAPGLPAGMVWYSAANKTLQMANGADGFTETALKSDLTAKANTADLATVATSGSYTDLTNKPSVPANLDDLGDVTLTSPSNGQVLKYNGTAWVNGTDSTGSGGTTLPADAVGWLHDDGTGTLAWTTPTKSDVGLGNVDNTSDATKNSAVATLTNKDLTSATNTFPTFNQDTTGTASNVTGTVAVSHGGTGKTSLTAYGVLAAGTTSTGALQQVSGTGSSGQVLTSNGAGALPTWQTAATGFTWGVITADTTAAANNGYITNSSVLVTVTLPASPAIGDTVKVLHAADADYGSGGWKLAQPTGQQVYFGNTSTTLGTGGSLASTGTGDVIEVTCILAGTSAVWAVTSSIGNITVV